MAAQSPNKWVVAVAAAVQLTCLGLALAATLVFITWEFFAVLVQWTWAYGPDDIWEQFRQKVTFYWSELKPGTRLFSGWDAMMLCFTYLPAMLATIAVLIPTLVLSKEARRAAWDCAPVRAAGAFGRKVAHFASCPVWPHRFWLWWCDGLSVWDAFLWCGMFVLHIVGVIEIEKYYLKRWKGWDAIGLAYPIPKSVDRLRYISLAFSWVLYIDFSILFFPVAHISFLHTILGSSWPALVKYHRWIGQFGMWTVTAHGVFYYLYWICNPYDNFWTMFFDWNKHGYIVYLAGTLSWLFGVALWVTSIAWVRRNYFKVFYVTHVVGFVGFVLFAHIHYYWSIYFFAAGLVVYGLDVVYRVVQGQNVSAISRVIMTPDAGLARLDIPLDPRLGATMKPGAEVFLQFPTLSRWDWHAFTVFKVNVPVDGTDTLPSMTVVVKKYGRWTQRLMRELEQSIATRRPVPVRLLGPTGGLHSLARRGASRIVMFVGGVGASPALAHVHELMAQHVTTPTTLVFSARTPHEFSVLDEAVLKAAATSSWLTIKLFNTAKGRCATCDAAGRTDARDSTDGRATLDKRTSLSSGLDEPAHTKLPPAAAKLPSLQRHDSSGSDDASGSDDKASGARLVPMLSAYGWSKARPMQPRLLNAWQTLFALLLMWMGAVMGLVQAQSAVVEKWGTVLTKHDYWQVGCIALLCVTVQAAGLPAAVLILPVHLYKYWKDGKRQQLMRNVASSASPSCQILGYNKLGVPEADLSLSIETGRPDVRALLRDALASTDEGEITVVAAGPRALCNDVDKAVWELNFGSRPNPRAFLHLIRETYEL